MKPENFIVNFTSSKFYKDFEQLHPNLLHQEGNVTQATNTYVGPFTPKKYSSPGKSINKELTYGEVRSPAHQSFRTPEKRNQSRMVIFSLSTAPINNILISKIMLQILFHHYFFLFNRLQIRLLHEILRIQMPNYSSV